MNYEIGLAALERYVRSDDTQNWETFNLYKGRLRQNMDKARLFGDTPALTNERNEIMFEFNRLARNLTGVSFVDLSRNEQPAEALPNSNSGSGSVVGGVVVNRDQSVVLKKGDIDRLVQILSNQAVRSPGLTPQLFFRGLVGGSNLNDTWKANIAGIWTGNANHDARELVNWTIGKGINPLDHNFTTLGSVLSELLPELGFDEAAEVASLINIYRLYRGKELDRLAIQFQIPQSPSMDEQNDDVGPDFDWRGPSDTEELQSFWKPEPRYLDVGFLQRAMKQATSVCLVTLPSLQRTGTGFLVTNNLVLTNYHVLKLRDDEDIDANARSLSLHFGFYTSRGDDPLRGQSFKLDQSKPIVAYSPEHELDFVLLRINMNGSQAIDLRPVDYDVSHLNVKSAINILQHPNGEEMKIVFNSNGVTGVYPDIQRVQYVSQTAGGSSGAPCYNDDWKVVAIHRSQRSRSFGQIREGVLFSAIYGQISPHL